MTANEASLILAADSYCTYLSGLVAVNTEPPEPPEPQALQAAERMYEGLRCMAAAAAISCFGKSLNKVNPKRDGRFTDEKMAAFAVESTDMAYERYADRLAAIGTLSVEQAVLRPCPVKQPSGMYLVRRARTDKLTLGRLSEGFLHDKYESLRGASLSDLRKLQS